MRRVLIVMVLAVALAGCGDRAKEMYETARFEEQQFNREHAVRLYREIIDRYPDSPYAAQARERLEELER